MSKLAVEKDPHAWTKHERLVYLLDQWEVIFDPSVTSPQGSPGDGSGIGLMPRMSRHPSVRELGRCLGVLRVGAPVQYSHLMAHHLAEWRVRVDHVRVRRAGGKFELVETRTRERMVPGWVRAQKVVSAHRSLADAFRGSVSIPDDLWDALTLSASEADAKAARRRARGRVAA